MNSPWNFEIFSRRDDTRLCWWVGEGSAQERLPNKGGSCETQLEEMILYTAGECHELLCIHGNNEVEGMNILCTYVYCTFPSIP